MENKNYYEWLEISKNASPEVIEKAYKALVKKYHPDLQEGNQKQKAEEIIKHINEAYSVLSDAIKKSEYDANLQDNNVSKEDYDKLKQELNNMKQNTNNYNNTRNTNQNYTKTYSTQTQSNSVQNNQTPTLEELEQQRQEEILRRQTAEFEYRQQVEAARQKAYHDAYIQDLKNRGYKIKYKKTFKDYLAVILTVVIFIIIAIVLWHIPASKAWLINLYNSNEVIKLIVNIFASIINAFVDSIH